MSCLWPTRNESAAVGGGGEKRVFVSLYRLLVWTSVELTCFLFQKTIFNGARLHPAQIFLNVPASVTLSPPLFGTEREEIVPFMSVEAAEYRWNLINGVWPQAMGQIVNVLMVSLLIISQMCSKKHPFFSYKWVDFDRKWSFASGVLRLILD